MTNLEQSLHQIIEQDGERLSILNNIKQLNLPDCWVGAGFVRNAVWDQLHDSRHSISSADIDVVFYDQSVGVEKDQLIEQKLRILRSDLEWSVTNQAHIHLYNKDEPYHSTFEAVSNWPETATCIAARLSSLGNLEFLAPQSLQDLFELKLRPTSQTPKKLNAFNERVMNKGWLSKWPRLQVVLAAS